MIRYVICATRTYRISTLTDLGSDKGVKDRPLQTGSDTGDWQNKQQPLSGYGNIGLHGSEGARAGSSVHLGGQAVPHQGGLRGSSTGSIEGGGADSQGLCRPQLQNRSCHDCSPTGLTGLADQDAGEFCIYQVHQDSTQNTMWCGKQAYIELASTTGQSSLIGIRLSLMRFPTFILCCR